MTFDTNINQKSVEPYIYSLNIALYFTYRFYEDYEKSSAECIPFPHEKFQIADYLLNTDNTDTDRRANILLQFNGEMY